MTLDLKNSTTEVTPIIAQSIQFFLCSETNFHVNVFTGSQSFLSQSFCSAEKNSSEKADKFSASRHVQLSKVWQYRLWSFQTRDTKLERLINIPNGNYWVLSFGLMVSSQKVPRFDFQSQFSSSKVIEIFLIFFHWL